jgi:CMP-N-acetylneuraminic acid synthetase
MNFVIVIPARGGSKRLPGKNLLKFGETSLLGFTIKFAKNCFPNMPIFVSTDDDKIGKEAKFHGSEVIKRPANLATDFSSTADVLIHCLQYFELVRLDIDAIILLQPTNPFRFILDLKEGVKQFIQSGKGSLATISLSKKKLCQISKDNDLTWLNNPGTRSQDLDKFHFENGNFYITKKDIIKEGKVISADCLPFIQTQDICTIDIDTKEDYVSAIALIPHYCSLNM